MRKIRNLVGKLESIGISLIMGIILSLLFVLITSAEFNFLEVGMFIIVSSSLFYASRLLVEFRHRKVASKVEDYLLGKEESIIANGRYKQMFDVVNEVLAEKTERITYLEQQKNSLENKVSEIGKSYKVKTIIIISLIP